MIEDRNRQEHLNHMKILFFIVARINGEYKKIDMNTEVNYESRIKYQHVNHTASQGKL